MTKINIRGQIRSSNSIRVWAALEMKKKNCFYFLCEGKMPTRLTSLFISYVPPLAPTKAVVTPLIHCPALQNTRESSKHVPVSLPVWRVPRLMTGVPNAPTSLTPQLLLPIIQPAWATSWMNWSNGTCFTARKLGWCSMPFFLITRTISLLPTEKQSK